MKISVVNISSLSTADIRVAIRAVNRQIAEDFAPYWDVSGSLRLERPFGEMGDASKPHEALRGDAIIYIVEDREPSALAGLHEQHYRGIPYGIVHVVLGKELEKDASGWTVTLSHEALELLADPHVNLLCQGPHPDPRENKRLVFHWFEMCDAVQSESYRIDGVLVSNFVLPAYFGRALDAESHLDFLGKSGATYGPFGVKPGGYVGFFDPELGEDKHFLRPTDQEAERRAMLREGVSGDRRRDRRAQLNAKRVGDSLPITASPDLPKLYQLLEIPNPVPAPAGVRAALAPPAHEPLGPQDIPALRKMMSENPEAVIGYFSIVRSRPVLREEAEGMIDELERSFVDPAGRIGELESRAARRPAPPPADFAFDGYPQDDIEIDTSLTKFETRADWFGYVVHAGLNAVRYHAGRLPVPPLRSHATAASRFLYLLDGAPETSDLPIALFSDFANGYYHTRYLARQMAKKGYRYAAHLGDVYYAGAQGEVDSYLKQPLQEMIDAQTELFLIEGNHEMYAKGVPWLAYIDDKHRANPQQQRQEGQYFRLKRNCPAGPSGVDMGFQIIAADTAWYENARYRRDELRTWLRDVLKEGRDEGRMNILLTSNEPYEYGKKGSTSLWSDLSPLLLSPGGGSLVDLWFWGNTHYCALFDRTPEFPFLASCIGHAGYPYERYFRDEFSPAPCRWVEDDGRFGREDVRPDRGNNGYCELTMKTDGTVDLTYFDWMGRTRHVATVRRGVDGVFFG